MKEYNVGIVGFGFIGKVHAYGHMNLPFFYDPVPCRTRITHVCTSRPETAGKAAALTGAEVATTDFRKVTEDPAVDIVHICTPNNLHREQLLSAIEQNKHIYCDKPLVVDAAEAREIESALGAYSAVGQMTLQSRFFPATLHAKQMIDEGFLGNVISFRAVYLHSGSVDPKKKMGWKQQKEFGGGVINDLASHVLDVMEHLAGPFESVLAETRILHARRPDAKGRMADVEGEDQVLMLVRHSNGAVGTIEASKIATGANDEVRFEIHGDRGALRFDLMQPNYLEAYDLGAAESPLGGTRGYTRIDTGGRYDPPAVFPPPKVAIGWLRGHAHCLFNFLSGVSRGEQVEPSLRRGVALQKMLDTVGRSAQAREWLSFEST